MRKKIYQQPNLFYRYYKKFCNLQKRIRLLMQSGEFYHLSPDTQHRFINRLKLLFNRIERLAGKQKLRWAGAVFAIILTSSVAQAQFNDTISLSGFYAKGNASPEFVDLDGDGDNDIVIGNVDGTLDYILNNNGEYSYATDNPFTGIDLGDFSTPCLRDLDVDGDFDLLAGSYDGTIVYFRNDTGTFTPLTGVDNPFNGIDIGYKSDPTMVNFDNDSDLDLVIGTYYGSFRYFSNNANVFTEMVGLDNPFNIINTWYFSSPAFADLDGDSDLDFFGGGLYGDIQYMEFDGGVFTERTGTDNPFDTLNGGWEISPTFIDIQGDGDLDLVLGEESTPHLKFFRNDDDAFIEKRGQPNPFEGIIGPAELDIMAPAFSDVDDDGDMDLIIGLYYATHIYYENTDEGFVPQYGDDDPFSNYPPVYSSRPVFVDIDNDGDEDLVIGDPQGYIHFMARETPDHYYLMTGDDNPFNGIDFGENVSPGFMDIDEDGDLDLFVGTYTGNNVIDFYRNVNGAFFNETGTDNPFTDIFTESPTSTPSLAFHDLDRDGDEDLFIGMKSTVEYAWNNDGNFAITDSRNPFLDQTIVVFHYPAFADVDNDGDKDFFVGGLRPDGAVLYFAECTQGPPIAVPQLEDAGIQIYSAAKTIYLNAGDEMISQVEVFNLAGSLILSRSEINSGTIVLPVPEFQSGLYLVRAFSDGKVSTAKVFIE